MSKPTTIGEILADWFSTVSDGTKYYPNGEYVQKSKAELAQLIRDCVPEKRNTNVGDAYQRTFCGEYNRAIDDINQAINKIVGDV